MANFAQVSTDKTVTDVIVLSDELEQTGQDFIANQLGLSGEWIAVSESVGIGFTYDAKKRKFFPPKPYNSWLWDTELDTWIAPVPRPEPELDFDWDEATLSWVDITAAEVQ